MVEQVRHCCLVHLQLLNQRLHCIAPPILLQHCDGRAEVDGSSGVMVSVRHYLGLVCHRDTIAAAADLHIPPPCWTLGYISTGEDTGVDTGRSRWVCCSR